MGRDPARERPDLRAAPRGRPAELQGLIQVFLTEKVFEGCDGLEITDEIRVTIAAQACMLLLHRDTDVYPKLITILVYPTAYVSNMPVTLAAGVVTEGPQGRLGEAWTSGVVVLSWDDVSRGAADVRDGHNVVFHEFAHQLDTGGRLGRRAPGPPEAEPVLRLGPGPRATNTPSFARPPRPARRSVLDTYGATEPAEFFAVATEAFFEKPVQLKKKHPELYEELKIYHAQDPEAEFVAKGGPVSGGEAKADREARRTRRLGPPCRRFGLLDGMIVVAAGGRDRWSRAGPRMRFTASGTIASRCSSNSS